MYFLSSFLAHYSITPCAIMTMTIPLYLHYYIPTVFVSRCVLLLPVLIHHLLSGAILRWHTSFLACTLAHIMLLYLDLCIHASLLFLHPTLYVEGASMSTR